MADTKLTDLTELAEAPAQTDLVEIVDVSDTTHDAEGTSKKLLVSNLLGAIAGLTAKTTLVDADSFPMVDSAASDAPKRVTGTNLKAYLKTYFDSLYALSSHNHTLSDVTDSGALAALNTVDTAQIDDDAVTYAKMQNVSATDRLLGRDTAGAGVVEEITPANVRAMINVEDNAAADQTDAEIETAYNTQVGVVSQVDAEAGTSTTVYRWTPQRVAQAIAALAAGGGSSDHGALTGLGDDDHTQYSLVDGTRPFTGKVSYDSAKTFTGDNEIVTKKYVDDEITGAVRYFQATVFDYTTDLTTGDGKLYLHVPPALAGMNLVYVHCGVITAGTTGTTDFQIHNVDQAADMLSTKATIDSGETGTDTAATAYVIDTANDDVASGDALRLDIDAVSTTAPAGLVVTLGFQLP